MVVARHPAATVVIVDGGEVGAGGVGGEAAVLVSVGVVGVDDGLSAVRWSKNVVGVTGAGLVVKADSFAMECSEVASCCVRDCWEAASCCMMMVFCCINWVNSVVMISSSGWVGECGGGNGSGCCNSRGCIGNRCI